jgi:DNA-binding SARP family transcriptional activator
MLDLGAHGASRHLVTIGNEVFLEPSRLIQVDTHRLELVSKRVLSRGGGTELLPEEEQDALAAVDGYGPFLDGYDGDWVLQERERLHCLFVRTTFELMRSAAKQGAYERALDLGRRILAMDPLRESVQRDVMLLLILNGQRVEAIRIYQRLVGLLRSELGIDPMPETKRLHDDILSGGIFTRIDDFARTQFGIERAPQL